MSFPSQRNHLYRGAVIDEPFDSRAQQLDGPYVSAALPSDMFTFPDPPVQMFTRSVTVSEEDQRRLDEIHAQKEGEQAEIALEFQRLADRQRGPDSGSLGQS